MNDKQANQVLENIKERFNFEKKKDHYKLNNPFESEFSVEIDGQSLATGNLDVEKEIASLAIFEIKAQFARKIAEQIFSVLDERGITYSDDIKNHAIGAVIQSFMGKS